MFGLKLGCWD